MVADVAFCADVVVVGIRAPTQRIRCRKPSITGAHCREIAAHVYFTHLTQSQLSAQ